MVLERAELSSDWRTIVLDVAGVNGTLSVMSEVALTYWVDDVVVTIN